MVKISKPRKIDELLLKRVKREYIDGGGDLKSICEMHGVPYTSVYRYYRLENWKALRDRATTQAFYAAFRDTEPSLRAVSRAAEQIEMLARLVEIIYNDIQTLGADRYKSKEAAIATFVKLLDALRARCPETLEEIVQRCIELNIDPAAFMRALDEAWRTREA